MTKELINQLIQDVEEAIVDLERMYNRGRGLDKPNVRVLAQWNNQGLVLDFKNYLKARFKKTLTSS